MQCLDVLKTPEADSFWIGAVTNRYPLYLLHSAAFKYARKCLVESVLISGAFLQTLLICTSPWNVLLYQSAKELFFFSQLLVRYICFCLISQSKLLKFIWHHWQLLLITCKNDTCPQHKCKLKLLNCLLFPSTGSRSEMMVYPTMFHLRPEILQGLCCDWQYVVLWTTSFLWLFLQFLHHMVQTLQCILLS